MYHPSQQEFLKLTRKGNLIPIYKEITGDLDTPVSAYFKIADKSSYSFLLESVEGGERIARYSFLATDPDIIIRGKDNKIEISRLKNGKHKKETKTIRDTPLSCIREIMAQYKFVNIPGLPRFCGGMVGYLGYDVVRFFEKLEYKPHDDLKLPDILLVLARNLVIFDHLNHKIKVVSCVHTKSGMPVKEKISCRQTAIKQIDKLVAKIHKPLTMKDNKIHDPSPPPAPSNAGQAIRSNISQERFETIVKKVKKKIRSGEIIQAVLSQRFEIPLQTDPFHIYRTLRSLNPSPYMYYLNFGDIRIIGSSPELLVRCENGLVETRPIAGTRPRGKNEKQDALLARDLLNDPKERAEHIMLVDLGRNDLGRVCRQGSICLSEFMEIEKYSHVMHIVSNIKGKLKKGQDAFDVLQAAFPAGTVSGAPKIRAMEIIDELENISRGPYAGCIGYFSFSGNLDSCITIRTIVVTKGKAYIQAGAGIVADSKPKKEYQETINKAKAQILAIQIAHNNFRKVN